MDSYEAIPSRQVKYDDHATVKMMADKVFTTACALAETQPTKAQARKFRHGRGKAFARAGEARQIVQNQASAA